MLLWPFDRNIDKKPGGAFFSALAALSPQLLSMKAPYAPKAELNPITAGRIPISTAKAFGILEKVESALTCTG